MQKERGRDDRLSSLRRERGERTVAGEAGLSGAGLGWERPRVAQAYSTASSCPRVGSRGEACPGRRTQKEHKRSLLTI